MIFNERVLKVSKTVISNTNDGSKVLLDKTIPTLEK